MDAEHEDESLFYRVVVADLLGVLIANTDQKKITFDQNVEALREIREVFPEQKEYESGKTSLPQANIKIEVMARLEILSKTFPIFQGVYKKYAAQVEKPVYCINCGTKLVSSALYCPDCGTKVTSLEEE